MSTRNFGDVVATTIASLRIGNNDKALFRLVSSLSFLGDYDLAQQTFDKLVPLCKNVTTMSKKFLDLENQLERCIKYRHAMIKGRTTSPEDALALTQDTPSCMGNWVHAYVETFLTKSKGRGLRATQNLAKGSVVLLEWPLVNETSDSSTKDIIVFNTEASTIHMGSSARLRSIVVNRLKREATLAQIMSHMSDGINTPGLVPVSDLLVNLEMFPFLLPTHREYCNLDINDDDNDGKKRETIKEITADHVDKILNTNSHGTSETILDDKLCRTELLPTVSMMNHASNPNCTFQKLSLNFLCMVVACKPIQAGEELTMKYHSDEVVEEKWGIKARN